MNQPLRKPHVPHETVVELYTSELDTTQLVAAQGSLVESVAFARSVLSQYSAVGHQAQDAIRSMLAILGTDIAQDKAAGIAEIDTDLQMQKTDNDLLSRISSQLRSGEGFLQSGGIAVLVAELSKVSDTLDLLATGDHGMTQIQVDALTNDANAVNLHITRQDHNNSDTLNFQRAMDQMAQQQQQEQAEAALE